MTLATSFVQSAKPPVRARLETVSNLEAKLTALVEAGRAAWPKVALDAEVFVRHAAARLDGSDPREAIAQLAAADLWLACACAQQSAAALATFDQELLPVADRAIRGVDGSPAFVDEVKQLLRQRLFFGEPPQSGPRILDYAGRGPLAGWLRAAALRLALNARRTLKGEVVSEEVLLELPAAAPDPDLEVIRRRYHDDFQACFRDALASLDAQDRNMLRLSVINGVGVKQIASHYQLHRTTVTRRLAAARETVIAETRRLLAERLKLTRSEMNALDQALRSNVDLQISQVLESPR